MLQDYALVMLMLIKSSPQDRAAPAPIGHWISRQKAPRFVGKKIILYEDPSKMDLKSLKTSGYEILIEDLFINKYHCFKWVPFGWTGTWSYIPGKLTLRTGHRYHSIDFINKFSTSSTNGIPDLNFT